MIRAARIALLVAASAALLATVPAGAQAAAVYRYSVSTYAANNNYRPEAYGTLYLLGVNAGQNTRVDFRHGAAPAYATRTQVAGSTSAYMTDVIGLVPGDTIEVRQPSGAVSPTETYVIPLASANFSVGSAAVTGSVTPGIYTELQSSPGCTGSQTSRSIGVTGGSFSATLSDAVRVGGWVETILYTTAGDSLQAYQYPPGEQPCVYVSSEPDDTIIPGGKPPAEPYRVGISGLSKSVAASTKLVQVRNGAPVFTTSTTNEYLSADSSVRTLPGDRFDIYRPQDATTPSFSYTVPQASAKFDPSIDLIAVDGPAFAEVEAYPCRQYTCPGENGRRARNRKAGRTFLNFAVATSGGPAADLRPTDRVFVSVTDEAGVLEYTFLAAPGDLVAPTQKLTVASKLKLARLIKAFKKGLKVKVRSNEAGKAKLTLALGKTKLATGSANAKVGSTTVKLKFTKSGKKALKKLKAKGRGFKSRKATFTSVVTDTQGNASTKVKSVTIKR